MPRYERTYTGEYRTEVVTVKFTPSERRELEDAATQHGAPKLSIFVRELLFRRVPTRRNPEAKAIIDAMNAAGRELQAIGNNLNQIARHLNTTGELRDWPELRDALALNRQWTKRHIAALDRVLASVGIT